MKILAKNLYQKKNSKINTKKFLNFKNKLILYYLNKITLKMILNKS